MSIAYTEYATLIWHVIFY